MKKTLLLLLPLLMLCSCNNEKTNTPLGWCVWEIQKHEGYENCAYTYQDLHANDMQKEAKLGGKVSAYIITTYVYPKRTEWFCLVEYNKIKNLLAENDVYSIDCDIICESGIYE